MQAARQAAKQAVGLSCPDDDHRSSRSPLYLLAGMPKQWKQKFEPEFELNPNPKRRDRPFNRGIRTVHPCALL
jgi:hypothetical protein